MLFDVRKAARLINQGNRSETSFLSTLTECLQTNIATFFGGPTVNDDPNLRIFAEEHLCKP